VDVAPKDGTTFPPVAVVAELDLTGALNENAPVADGCSSLGATVLLSVSDPNDMALLSSRFGPPN
jgi:hypothetical protein